MGCQEVAGRVRAVDLESLSQVSVPLNQPEVMEHGSDVEQFRVRLQTAALAVEHPEQERSSGVVVQQR